MLAKRGEANRSFCNALLILLRYFAEVLGTRVAAAIEVLGVAIVLKHTFAAIATVMCLSLKFTMSNSVAPFTARAAPLPGTPTGVTKPVQNL